MKRTLLALAVGLGIGLVGSAYASPWPSMVQDLTTTQAVPSCGGCAVATAPAGIVAVQYEQTCCGTTPTPLSGTPLNGRTQIRITNQAAAAAWVGGAAVTSSVGIPIPGSGTALAPGQTVVLPFVLSATGAGLVPYCISAAAQATGTGCLTVQEIQ